MTHSDMVKQRVADAIEQYMEAHDISQGGLAERLGVHQTAISAYAQQRTMPRADVFLRMIKVFDLKPEEMMPPETNAVPAHN